MTEMPPYRDDKDEGKNSGQDDSDSCSDVDDLDLPLTYDEPRHLEPIKGEEQVEHSWRVKEKYKTHCVALVLCLNVGVDPPDVVKTQPCARLECWLDPQSMSQSKALESIGHALQTQYERWQPRARYKQSLDPTSDEVKKLCCSLRRNAKDERVLFHYNGHGVPKPTAQGEIWVFNRSYTQYIPLSMYDLQTWMGAPSLYVYDCSNAGLILDNFRQFAEQHEREYEAQVRAGAAEGGGVSYRNCIQLAACAAGQSLPMNPELPADLFTACLTTPVKMAMKWFVARTRTRIAARDLHDLIDKIPGAVTDRRTMLGELNWIFTAVTDTVAWSSLPPALFQRLFRADLLTASLCRNFLLAERIMRGYNCTPRSAPPLPALGAHPLWAAWEHTLDAALAQLPALAAAPGAEYRHSAFFRDQLTAFAVWLARGAGVARAPAQLPMVLQVLLSTLHRVRALQLLCAFLARAPAHTHAVLAVGIFPYMLKLLQASAPNLRASMVYIWARIVAADPSCQADLVNAKGHKYFLAVLQDPTVDSDHRTLAAFVLAGIVDNYPPGQEAALQGSMISICLEQVRESHAPLVQWACVALGRLWRGFDAARWTGVRDLAHEKLYPLMKHAHPEVRAGCAFALGAFMAAGGARSEHADALVHQVAAHLAACLPADASPLVRCEVLAALQWVVIIFEQTFIAVYLQERGRRSDREGEAGGRVDPGQDALAAAARAPPLRHAPHPIHHPVGFGSGSMYMKVWGAVCALARSPQPQEARMAADIVAHVAAQVDSVGREAEGRASSSLPPSPNTQPSPLHDHARGHRRGKSSLPHTISEDSVAARDRDSAAGPSPRKPIVSTQFVEWAAAQLWRPAGDAARDPEHADTHARAWRRLRDTTLRAHAAELRSARASRLDAQVFQSRCVLPPGVLHFHPYEQHVALANKDNFGIWDWGSGAKLCAGGWARGWGRITALQYVNAGAGAGALLAAASHAGHVCVFRPAPGPAPAPLVAAWRALDVPRHHHYRPPPAQPLYSLAQLVSEQFSSNDDRLAPAAAHTHHAPLSGGGGGGEYGAPPGTVVAWCARRQRLAVGGAARTIRLWDCAAERAAADIATDTEAAVTALRRARHTLVAGFSDGAVRLWDERAPRPLLALHQHAAPLRAAAARPSLHALVTVCAAGEVRVYDSRARAPRAEARAPAPLAAADVHARAQLVACGSVNQAVAVLDLRGTTLNTIKFHEGFMGARIGPVSCLAFHPLRCALGVGSKDCTVSVYAADPRR